MTFDPRADYGSPSGGGKIPAEGRHVCYVTKAALKESRSGNPMIEMELTVIDQTDPDEGKTIKEWIVLVEESWGYGKLASMCRAIDSEMPGVADDGFDPHDQESIDKYLLGEPVPVEVVHEDDKWEDRKGRVRHTTKARVYYYHDDGLTDEEVDRLAAQYSEGGERYLAPPVPGQPDGPPDDVPPPDDEDIPF